MTSYAKLGHGARLRFRPPDLVARAAIAASSPRGCSMVKLISWNLARRDDTWRRLPESDADIALVQEARKPPPDVAARIAVDPWPWFTAGAGVNRPWRTAIVKLSHRVDVAWIEPRGLTEAEPGDLAVSRPGTLAAATVTRPGREPIVVVSLYGLWERPHSSTRSRWIYADASVHRLISDMSVFIGRQAGHRLVVAGDLNILYGYGELGSRYWESRYATAFARFEALGLTFVGPQAPFGRRAEPWPQELPPDSDNVPTYHSNRQTPATAARQLDFAFVSDSLAESVQVRALNEIHEWGPGDHCRLEILVE